MSVKRVSYISKHYIFSSKNPPHLVFLLYQMFPSFLNLRINLQPKFYRNLHRAVKQLDVFLSFSLNWINFLFCPSLPKSLRSTTLDTRNILGDRILYVIGVSTFLQFCPNLRLVYQNTFCVLSFLVQVLGRTNDLSRKKAQLAQVELA